VRLKNCNKIFNL